MAAAAAATAAADCLRHLPHHVRPPKRRCIKNRLASRVALSLLLPLQLTIKGAPVLALLNLQNWTEIAVTVAQVFGAFKRHKYKINYNFITKRMQETFAIS